MENAFQAILQDRPVITGGRLGEAVWLPEFVEKNGTRFVALQSRDYHWTRFCGMPKKASWANNAFHLVLRELRNDAVNKYIDEQRRLEDPMLARLASASGSPQTTRSGGELVQFGVPDYLSITLPSFVAFGKSYPEQTVTVMTTARDDVSVHVELKAATIALLGAFAASVPQLRAERRCSTRPRKRQYPTTDDAEATAIAHVRATNDIWNTKFKYRVGKGFVYGYAYHATTESWAEKSARVVMPPDNEVDAVERAVDDAIERLRKRLRARAREGSDGEDSEGGGLANEDR